MSLSKDQLVPKRAHHHVGIEHMIPEPLMAAKIKEAVAARRSPDFLIIGRTNAVRASTMDDALHRGEAYRKAGADVLLLSMARTPEQLRLIAERLGGPRVEKGLRRPHRRLRREEPGQDRLGPARARHARRHRHREAARLERATVETGRTTG